MERSGDERWRWETGAVGQQRGAHKVEDGPALVKQATVVGPGVMGGAPPPDRMAEGALGRVVGRLDAGCGHQAPQGLVQGDQVTAGLGGARAGASDALGSQ